MLPGTLQVDSLDPLRDGCEIAGVDVGLPGAAVLPKTPA
jgi:hypothetical protein